eukprot:scaffold710_cov171-Amphora_coffeaeformis.AAC.22
MDDDVIPMVICPHCEHLVPETNLALHEARCQGRKRPARDTATTTAHNDEASSDESDGDREHHQSTRQNRGNGNMEQEPFLPRARWEAPPAAGSAPQHSTGNTSDTPIVPDIDDDSYMSDDDVAFVSQVAAPAVAASQHEVIDLVGDESEGAEHWCCPRCTLQNSASSSSCEACSFRRPETERPPDQVRRERLIGEPQPGGSGGLISGAALLGSVLGGTGAYLRGQPLSSGLLNGAMTGAVSGVVLNELARNETRQGGPLMQQQSQTFVSAGSWPAMQSISIVRTPDGRVVATRSGNGTSSTASYGGGGGVARANPPVANNPNNELNQLLSSLIAHQLIRNQGGAQQQRMNPDQMSYEQLLQMFGSGTENMAAGERQIRSLPSATIQDVDKLPPDSRQCSICLEDFKTGDERKIMPCLHGFHADCVDKWLRTNGSCPICKHRLEK